MLKIFRIITNIRFYAGIVCMLFFVLLLSKTDALSFRWLPALSVVSSMNQWDITYVSQKKIANAAVLLAYANISLWHTRLWGSIDGLQDLDGDTMTKALTSIKNLQSITSTNVLQIRDSKQWVTWLSTLIQQGKIALSQSQGLATILQWSIDELLSKVSACTAQKEKADELYRQGLTANNSTMINQATLQAQESSTCISTLGVSTKSMNGVLITLQSEIVKTQKYITLVETNQQLLAQYNELLDGEVPSQLVQLQKDFQSL